MEIDVSGLSDTPPTQKTPEFGDADMSKWPKKIKFHNKVLAKIYQPCRGRDSYRVTWYAAAKRQMKSFPIYAGCRSAKEFAETKVKELANNSQSALLTPTQATDSLAAIERLGSFYRATGRKVSLLALPSRNSSPLKNHARKASTAIVRNYHSSMTFFLCGGRIMINAERPRMWRGGAIHRNG
jgi:hypothetical protein